MNINSDMIDDRDWVPCLEAMPAQETSYLVHAPSADPDEPMISLAWYRPGYGWSGLPRVWCDAITHWMRKPNPPKGGPSRD